MVIVDKEVANCSYGKDEALPILKADGFELNFENLEKILYENQIAEMPVAVISIAGAYRTGKSFILNFFLRYFKANAEESWLESEDNLKDGFCWKPGSTPHTSGIMIWSRPFIIENNGEKIAVILMDTQGNFDHQTEKSLCTQIFALSTLISSVQIYNLMRQIQDNDLEYLQFFVEFTKISQQKGDDANTTQKQREPFQKLVFVVRDWPHKRNHGYGIEGGKTYLRDECKIGTKKGESSARKDLPDTFKTIDCFLMPYPGQKVDSPEDDFAGQLKDMEDPFKKNVRKLVEHVCKNLVPKTYNGKSHTGETLLEHIKTCYRIMKGAKLDLTKTLVELISEDQNTQIRDACVTSFTVKLEQELENNITEQELENNITPDEKFKKKVKVIKEELVQKSKLEFIGSSDCTQSSEKKLLKAMNEKENHYINLTRKVNEQLKKAEAEMKQYIEKTPEKKDSEEDSEEIQNICDNALKNIGIYLGDSSDKVLETVRNRLARLAKKECNDANNRMEGKVLIYTALGGAGVGGVAGGVAAGSATIIAEAALPMVALATGGTALIGAVAIGLLSFGIAKFKANIDTKQHEKRE